MGSQQRLEECSKETHTVTQCPRPQEDHGVLALRNGVDELSTSHRWFCNISSERIYLSCWDPDLVCTFQPTNTEN